MNKNIVENGRNDPDPLKYGSEGKREEFGSRLTAGIDTHPLPQEKTERDVEKCPPHRANTHTPTVEDTPHRPMGKSVRPEKKELIRDSRKKARALELKGGPGRDARGPGTAGGRGP